MWKSYALKAVDCAKEFDTDEKTTTFAVGMVIIYEYGRQYSNADNTVAMSRQTDSQKKTVISV